MDRKRQIFSYQLILNKKILLNDLTFTSPSKLKQIFNSTFRLHKTNFINNLTKTYNQNNRIYNLNSKLVNIIDKDVFDRFDTHQLFY
jgi:hypothetical protein